LPSVICPWHCSHRGTETGAACLSCPLKHQKYLRWSVLGAYGSPAPKMRTSADSSQAEGASLENCCSASSAHGTARTEAQRLGLLACLAPSNFKRSLGGLCWAPTAALLQKCERLQIARSRMSQPGKLLLSLICPWHCSHRGTETGAACLSCPLKLQT